MFEYINQSVVYNYIYNQAPAYKLSSLATLKTRNKLSKCRAKVPLLTVSC